MTAEGMRDLSEALERLHRCIVLDARDWSKSPRDARIYSLAIGWDDSEGDAWREVQERHGWTDDEVDTLKRLNAAINAHKGTHRSKT